MTKFRLRGILSKMLLLLIVTFFCANLALAQDELDGPGGPCDPDLPPEACDPDVAVPLDGGAGMLVAAGVAYGIKKIRDKRKQNKEEAL